MVDPYPAVMRSGQMMLRAIPLDLLHSALGASEVPSHAVNPPLAISPDCFELVRSASQPLDAMRIEPGCAHPSLWAVESPAIRRMIGYVGFREGQCRPGPDGIVEVDCAIGRAYRRRGFGRDAVTALVSWARDRHAVRRVESCLPETASASIAFARALGFVDVSDAAAAEGGLFRLSLAESAVRGMQAQPPRRIIPYVIDF